MPVRRRPRKPGDFQRKERPDLTPTDLFCETLEAGSTARGGAALPEVVIDDLHCTLEPTELLSPLRIGSPPRRCCSFAPPTDPATQK